MPVGTDSHIPATPRIEQPFLDQIAAPKLDLHRLIEILRPAELYNPV
jgi:hypothetical protein